MQVLVGLIKYEFCGTFLNRFDPGAVYMKENIGKCREFASFEANHPRNLRWPLAPGFKFFRLINILENTIQLFRRVNNFLLKQIGRNLGDALPIQRALNGSNFMSTAMGGVRLPWPPLN